MTPTIFLLVAIAGGIGAVCRFVLDGVIRSRVVSALPWGTIVINVTGSIVLGFLAGLASANILPADALSIAGKGFLGGYTTFSTASFETVRMLQERRWSLAIVNGIGVLVTGIAAAGLGLWIGSSL